MNALANPMHQLEQLARTYRQHRDVLAERATALHEEMEASKRRAMRGLRAAVAAVSQSQAEIEAFIAANPLLFVKPRTVVFNGVKLGLQKGKGKIEWDDDNKVINLIRKHLPDQADVLISTVEKPSKDALAGLPASDLKRLGVTVQEAGDAIVIKDTTAAVDKLVDALVKGAQEEAEAAS